MWNVTSNAEFNAQVVATDLNYHIIAQCHYQDRQEEEEGKNEGKRG